MCSLMTVNEVDKMDYEFSITDLPHEILLIILNFLPPRSRANCSLVSKFFAATSKDYAYWRGVFVQHNLTPTSEGPSPRLWSSSGVIDDKMYIYGGHTTMNILRDVREELFEYDFHTHHCRRIKATGLHKITEHKCIEYNNTLWFVGGYSNYKYTNLVLVFSKETCEMKQVTTHGDPFSPRSALTAVLNNDKVYTFGGWNGALQRWYNDIHELDLKTLSWRYVDGKGAEPPNRTSHAAVTYNNAMYIFAGYSGEVYLNDLHRFDFEKEEWQDLTRSMSGKIPCPRSRFCAVVHGNIMYVLGGWNKVSYFQDMYALNLDTLVWSEITSEICEVPGLSQYAVTKYNGVLYFFGGYSAKEKDCSNVFYAYKLPDLINS